MSDSHSNRSFPSMSSSSEETYSGCSSSGLAGSSNGLTGKSEQNNNNKVTVCGSSPRPLLGSTRQVSNRSSVSSLASMTSTSLGGTSSNSLQPQSLNQALARVNNKWDREQRKHDQEATRKLTLLKQRKISAVLKVENLQKSLKNVSNNEASSTIQNKLKQVRELEEEVAVVDRELDILGEEREQNSRKLNLKRVQHVTTLQQLGLLEALALSDSETSGTSLRWRSEADLKASEGVRRNNHQPNSMTEENLLVSGGSRKISPPLAAILSEASRIRSGSDPALAMNMNEPSRTEPIVRFFRSQDENRKPSTESMGSLTGSRPSRWGGHRTPDSSPKSGRRNPLRMLSNAMDFRSRKRGSHRPKSADFERVSENPAGDARGGGGGIDLSKPDGHLSRLLTPPPNFTYTLTNSRYSLPNLDPNDMEEAMNIVRTSPFMTNPRKGTRHPPPLHPLENRNSAPEIVVTSTGSPQPGLYYQQAPSATSTNTSRRLHHGGLEERIQRAKAKVQNGLLHIGSGSSISSSSSSSMSTFTAVPATVSAQGPASMGSNGIPGLPPTSNNTGGRAKLSTRFQTAQKLNYKLAALSSFSTSIHVKRSRTFNVSDVQDQLAAMGHNNNNNLNNGSNSKTLPKQLRNSKLKSASRDSSELISSGLYRQSSPSSISVGTISGTSSTASSRKSSNSSSNGGGCDPNVRTQINQEALNEIAAFEDFMNKFLVNHCDDVNNGTLVPQSQSMSNLGSTLGLTSTKKKKNALRRIAAVNSEPKNQTLQRQRQLSSQESDEITPT